MSADARNAKPILVGVDPTDSARVALDWAVDVAAATGAPLHLLHAILGDPKAMPSRMVPPYIQEMLAAAERGGVSDDVVEIVPGSTVELLRIRARDARMVVLGSYGDGAWSGTLVGSIALGLAGHVDCPVAVVRGAAPGVPPPRSGSVIVGTDGSEAARRVVDVAAELAAAIGAGLLVVHAWTDVETTADGLHRSAEGWTVLEGAARARLDDEQLRISTELPNLTVAGELVAATPLQALLDRAREARMVVVGHREGPAGMAGGSTMQSLIEFAPCPVVWVPTSDAREHGSEREPGPESGADLGDRRR